jgi:ketosteroid isomerase-like protein
LLPVDTREVMQRYYDSIKARDWDGFAELLSPDVVYEMPQTRERISGREPYVQFNREYPGEWQIDVTRLVVDGDRAAGTMNFMVDGETVLGIGFFELTDGQITRITDIWPEPYEPPPGREHLAERLPDLSEFIDRL